VSELVFEADIFLLWGGVIAMGAVLSFITFRAAFRQPSTSLLSLGGGILFVGVAAPSFWLGSYLITDNLELCSTGTALITMVGFAVLIYSVLTRSG